MQELNRPVFVIGAARTGTTWISNILQQNFDYYTPSHFLHFGVKEPNLFLLDELYDKLGDRDLFIEKIKDSDIITLIKPDGVDLDSLTFSSYHEMFCQLMDLKAAEVGKPWFTKIDPDYFYSKRGFDKVYNYLISRYPEAKFIVVERNFRDYLDSYVNMPGEHFRKRQNPLLVVFLTALAAFRYKNLYRYAPQHIGGRYASFSYDAFVTDFEGQVNKMHSFLQKPITGLQNINTRNSSRFSGNRKVAGWMAKMLYAAASLYSVNSFVLKIFVRMVRRSDYKLYIRIKLLEQNPLMLIEILEKEGHNKLANEVRAYLK